MCDILSQRPLAFICATLIAQSGVYRPYTHANVLKKKGANLPENASNAVFQGEEKVLVTGPWYSQSAVYQILFNGVGVETTLVQSGVLRCYAPGNVLVMILRMEASF